MQGDPSHTYLGTGTNRDGVSVDVWQTIDADGRTLQWDVLQGVDSRDVEPGSLRVVSEPAAVTGGPVKLAPVKGDPSHEYLGTDANGDNWQTTDAAGNVVKWAVKPGDDSRNAIGGSIYTVPAPVKTVTVTGSNDTGPGAASNAPAPAPVSNPAPNYVNPATSTPAAVAPSQYPVANALRIQGNSAHRYAGSDSTKDFWELTDSDGSIVRWAVPINRDSREIIPGSIVRVGSVAVTPPNSGVTPGGQGGGGVDGTAGTANTTGVSNVDFVHPVSGARGQIPTTWRPVGTAANGDPIFAVIDADGATKTFALDSQFQAYWTNGAASGGLAGKPTVSLPAAQAASDSKAILWVGIGVAALKALVLT